MKLAEIQDLIKFVSKSGVNEVELETKEVKIVIRTGNKQQGTFLTQQPPMAIPQQTLVSAPVATVAPTTSQTATPTTEGSNPNHITIKSPMIGTFYSSSSPDKPAFVKEGDSITVGKPICIIEAMKLFNEIESEVKGKVVKILVNNATPVEYDQPLFIIDPS